MTKVKMGSPMSRLRAARTIKFNRSQLRDFPGMWPGIRAGYKSEITRIRNWFK